MDSILFLDRFAKSIIPAFKISKWRVASYSGGEIVQEENF